MSPLDAVWHILNFLAPAAFIASFSTVAAKWLWRRELRTTSWRRLFAWAMLPTLAVAVAGLVVFGRDGRMTTYAAMVGATALGLWLAGQRGRSG